MTVPQAPDAVDAAETGRRDDIDLSYYTVQPSKWTFQSDKIRGWVTAEDDGRAWWRGRVLNACAGRTKLAEYVDVAASNHVTEIVRNDVDESIDADHHYDVCDIATHLDAHSFDTIVFDPPYSEYQANEHYDGQQVGRVAAAKRQFHRLLAPGGRVIQFGYTTTCMPRALRYERRAVAVFNTLGQQNDILGTVDEREHAPLSSFATGGDGP